MKWYFQTVHHDEWDYDVSNPPMRLNPKINGKTYQVLAIGGKSGWEFVRNAVNGRPTPGFPAPETKVLDLNQGKGAALNLTWPTQPEPTGGAGQILPHCMTAAEAQTLYPGFPNAPNGTPIIPTCTFANPYSDAYYTWYPAFSGGINWWRSAYNPTTNDLYICANVSTEGFENLSPTSPNQATIGTFNGGYGGTISALNMSSNKLDWQIKIPPEFTSPGGPAVQNGSCSSGDLATASGLVFVAKNAQTFGDGTPTAIPAVLYAYDAKSGKELWSWTNNLGSLMKSQAMTYMVGNKQYLTIMATSPTQGAAATAPGTDHLTTFALG
jgi:glucose dehydrogenase